jgi:hypothetical protein
MSVEPVPRGTRIAAGQRNQDSLVSESEKNYREEANRVNKPEALLDVLFHPYPKHDGPRRYQYG